MIVTRISIEMDGISPAKIKFWKGDDLVKQGEFEDFSIRQRYGVIPAHSVEGPALVASGEDQIEISGTYHVINS